MAGSGLQDRAERDGLTLALDKALMKEDTSLVCSLLKHFPESYFAEGEKLGLINTVTKFYPERVVEGYGLARGSGSVERGEGKEYGREGW